MKSVRGRLQMLEATSHIRRTQREVREVTPQIALAVEKPIEVTPGLAVVTLPVWLYGEFLSLINITELQQLKCLFFRKSIGNCLQLPLVAGRPELWLLEKQQASSFSAFISPV